jgi:XTP/dITP diphosphohydrolase
MDIIFATNNQHKIDEIQAILPATFRIITLKAAGIDIEIPEPHDTLEANAQEKARTIHTITGQNCFSEDTGLEVHALNGEPGVKSARYAGTNRSALDNMNKLLNELNGNLDRIAQFRTVICLIIDKKEFLFEGICKGNITTKQEGRAGFGYDPIFIPSGAEKTFAQMSLEEKGQYSHRSKAVDKLVTFLNNYH